jgi:hypothetical protein
MKCLICGAVDNEAESFDEDSGVTFLVLERDIWQGLIIVCCTGCHSELVRAKVTSPLYVKYLAEYAVCNIIEQTPLGLPPLVGQGNWEEYRVKLTQKILEANERIYAVIMDLSKFLREHIGEMRDRHLKRLNERETDEE